MLYVSMLVKEHKDDFNTTHLFFIKNSITTHSQIIKQGKQMLIEP